MKHIALMAILLVTLAGLTQASNTLADPTSGKWIVDSVIRDGKADDDLKGATRIHEGEKYSVTPVAGSKSPTVSGLLVVDAKKKPFWIEMKPSAGRYKDKTLLGIAKVDEDKLMICFAEPGKDRPTIFDSKEGSGVVLVVHTRAK